jgi:serine/threonine-protein kinase
VALLFYIPVLVVLLSGKKPTLAPSTPAPAPAQGNGLSDARLREARTAGSAALEQLAREFPDDARVQRALVRAHTSEGHGAAAMRALGRLVTLDPDAVDDAEMTEALRSALDGPFDASAAAIRVAESSFGGRGVEILFDCANISGPAQPRCRQALLKPDVRAHASAATRLLLDLDDANDCESKHTLVLRAKDEADARALPALHALEKRFGCGRRGKYDCWACLHRDGSLEQAISSIEARTAPK